MNYHFKNELVSLDFLKNYSVEDSVTLMQGFMAPTMDDKWDIIYKENQLNFYRSWTGIGVYKLEFEIVENELHVKNAFVDEKFITNYSQEYCSGLLNWMIEVIVLKRSAEMPKWNY